MPEALGPGKPPRLPIARSDALVQIGAHVYSHRRRRRRDLHGLCRQHPGRKPSSSAQAAVHAGRARPRHCRGSVEPAQRARARPGRRRAAGARHHRRHQRVDPAPGRQGRGANQRRLSRPAGDRAADPPQGLRHAPRLPEAAGAAQASPGSGGAPAGRRWRACPPRRRGGRRGRPALGRRRRRLRGRLLPALPRLSGARAAGGRTPPRRHGQPGRHPDLVRGLSGVSRIRAVLDGGAERRALDSDERLSRPLHDRGYGPRHHPRADSEPERRRLDVGQHDPRLPDPLGTLRAGRRRARRGLSGADGRLSQRDHPRRRRHQRRRQPAVEGRADPGEQPPARRLSAQAPDPRRQRGRRRRRFDRLDRSGRVAQGRAGERRRETGPGLLRPGRRGCHGHRCQRHPGALARPRPCWMAACRSAASWPKPR